MQSAKIQVSKGPRNESKGTRDLESVANGQEPAVATPAAAEADQAGEAQGTAPVEAADAPTAAELGDRTEGNDGIFTLEFGVFLPKRQHFLHRSRATVFCAHPGNGPFRAHRLREMKHDILDFPLTAFGGRKIRVGDVVIHPVILAGLERIPDGPAVIDLITERGDNEAHHRRDDFDETREEFLQSRGVTDPALALFRSHFRQVLNHHCV
jgi:hypothetical protein